MCSEAQLVGNITIGARTVVHPSAKILAEGGPIIIGESNLIQEKAIILNRKKSKKDEPKTMEIGNGNVFAIASNVQCASIGNNNTFESKCDVGSDVTVTNCCVVGAGCEVLGEETLSENTIVFGADCRRYHKNIPLQTTDQQQLEYLIKVLPNYHHLIKSSPST